MPITLLTNLSRASKGTEVSNLEITYLCFGDLLLKTASKLMSDVNRPTNILYVTIFDKTKPRGSVGTLFRKITRNRR